MQTNINNTIKRILVSMDFDDYDNAYIEPLIALASQFNAELCTLFTESSELQKIADLSFSREITFPLAKTRELNKNDIARYLQRNIESLRKIMKDISATMNVTCTFKTVKGSRFESTLNESYNYQVIILLPESRSLIKKRLPDKLEKLINHTVLFFDNSEQSIKSLYIINSLAQRGYLHDLDIITLCDDDNFLAQQTFSSFNKNINIRHNRISSDEIKDIILFIKHQINCLLIAPFESRIFSKRSDVIKILDAINCPLMLVR